MPRVPFHLLDVFAERPLEGNQLCVLPDSPDLDEAVVARLANEIGFSETAWILGAEPEAYRMRIFTPATELPFAGHPSLGAAFLLASLGRTARTCIQTVPGGTFEMRVDLEAGESRMRQGDPVFGPVVDDVAAVAAAIGLEPAAMDAGMPVRTVDTGIAHLIVPVASEDEVRRAQSDGRHVRSVTGETGAAGIYLFASERPGEALARFFGPGVGVEEDAATGSAAGPLCAYLAEHAGLRGPLTVRQGEQIGRPSVLRAEVRDGGVWVSGGVHVIGRGSFDVPDGA